jgi:SAM-dependent methyltransferase
VHRLDGSEDEPGRVPTSPDSSSTNNDHELVASPRSAGDAFAVGAGAGVLVRTLGRAVSDGTGTGGEGKRMQQAVIRQRWDAAAPGWARWEATIAAWMTPATEAMLAMAHVDAGAHVLDLACGAGSQTLDAARRVGPQGSVLAIDISDTMLQHLRENARAAGLANVTTLAGAAEDLEVAADNFDAAICRLGLMLFVEPARALAAVRRVLRPEAKLAVVVFATPETNPFMAKPMQILLRHAGKAAPAPGQPGIFSLGAPGVLEQLLAGSGFVGVEQRRLDVPLRVSSAALALTMMTEAFGAYRAVIADSPRAVQDAAWAHVAETLKAFETETGFAAPAEVLVAAGVKPA